MKAQYLGHVVFYVEDVDRSLAFYRDLLGFTEVGRTFGGKAAALTSGRTHHELLLIEVGPAPGLPTRPDHDTRPPRTRQDAPLSGDTRPPRTAFAPTQPPARRDEPGATRDASPSPGFYHIGIKIGDSLEALRLAKAELDRAGIKVTGMSDHTVSQSVYLADPDGNEVELYVDADPTIWRERPEAVLAPIKPLRL